MLLDSKYTIVPQIKFTLTYDNGVRKTITVKTKDTISCSYKKNGERFFITGIVVKIGCNFNSSLGSVGTTAYMQIDGSSEYKGRVEYIQPNQVLDLIIVSTTDTIENVVCSVDNFDQKITLIRENEVGVFQYSLDGITWRAANGAQGISAYQCALELGYTGTEEEWLASLKGEKGDPGEISKLEIYRTFESIEEAEELKDLIPERNIVAILNGESDTIILMRNSEAHGRYDINDETIEIDGYEFLGYLTLGPTGEKGKDGKSAYWYAVQGGYQGTEEEFMQELANVQPKLHAGDHISINSRNEISVNDIGEVPENRTVVGMMDDLNTLLTNKIARKQDTLVEGNRIRIDENNIIEALDETIGETITNTVDIGGISKGTVIESQETLVSIIKQILCPTHVAPNFYFGVTEMPAITVRGMVSEAIDESVALESGVYYAYTANNQYLAFGYESRLGDLVSIKDRNGFEQISAWTKVECINGGKEYFIYRNDEPVTISNFKLTFYFQ